MKNCEQDGFCFFKNATQACSFITFMFCLLRIIQHFFKLMLTFFQKLYPIYDEFHPFFRHQISFNCQTQVRNITTFSQWSLRNIRMFCQIMVLKYSRVLNRKPCTFIFFKDFSPASMSYLGTYYSLLLELHLNVYWFLNILPLMYTYSDSRLS